MNILFGLQGGIGNALFCLPAILKLSRRADVSLLVGGDYPMADLFARCAFVKRVYRPGDTLPPFDEYLCGQYAPPAPRVRWRFCGWPKGTTTYDMPEHEQVSYLATGDRGAEYVGNWAQASAEKDPFTLGIIPGCKPGPVWERKRFLGMEAVCRLLEAAKWKLRIFGQRADAPEPLPGEDLRDKLSLAALPDALCRCCAVISTDSGIGHLASSLWIPTVMIFTATSPVKGRPMGPHVSVFRGLKCSPCQSTPRWPACVDWKCRKIEPDSVVHALDHLLR